MTAITGYRQLSPDEIAEINDIKAFGEELRQLGLAMRANPQLDQRWVSIGLTDIQTGLMALTRAVAQPTGF